MRRFLQVATTSALALALTGCAGNGPGPQQHPVTGVPGPWLEKTAEGWPKSDGYGSSVPVIQQDDCLLESQVSEIAGHKPDMSNTGWGPYGDGDEGYRYLCEFASRGNYAGEVQIMRGDEATITDTVDDFKATESTDVQDNSVEPVTVEGVEFLVLTRWYPTNPQGMYQALYHDENANALVTLEVNSLSEEDFESLGAEGAAKALYDYLASAPQ